jgi:predicted nucleic acid-binding protein
MFLLDTNVISELRRPDKADRNVVAWGNAIPAASFFISAISILEIELGALLIARKDAAQGAVLLGSIIRFSLGSKAVSWRAVCTTSRSRSARRTRRPDRSDRIGSWPDGRHS